MFTLRIWCEELGDGRFEIRGHVKRVPTGEMTYFREWSTLQSFLAGQVQMKEATHTLGEGAP